MCSLSTRPVPHVILQYIHPAILSHAFRQYLTRASSCAMDISILESRLASSQWWLRTLHPSADSLVTHQSFCSRPAEITLCTISNKSDYQARWSWYIVVVIWCRSSNQSTTWALNHRWQPTSYWEVSTASSLSSKIRKASYGSVVNFSPYSTTGCFHYPLLLLFALYEDSPFHFFCNGHFVPALHKFLLLESRLGCLGDIRTVGQSRLDL